MPPGDTRLEPALHPLHAILLGFPVVLFTSALVSDIAYLNSAEIQWTNFAQWLNAGALVFGGLVLVFALLRLLRARRRGRGGRASIYPALIAAMWVIGLINAFHHSRDGWSSVGTLGVALSALTTLLALVAACIAYGWGRSPR